jgi:hypothetical protein
MTDDSIVSITELQLRKSVQLTARYCDVCKVQLGTGAGMCKRAQGSNTVCYECAIAFDPPELPKTLDEDYGYTIDGRPA